jgi:hypothetical protein
MVSMLVRRAVLLVLLSSFVSHDHFTPREHTARNLINLACVRQPCDCVSASKILASPEHAETSVSADLLDDFCLSSFSCSKISFCHLSAYQTTSPIFIPLEPIP